MKMGNDKSIRAKVWSTVKVPAVSILGTFLLINIAFALQSILGIERISSCTFYNANAATNAYHICRGELTFAMGDAVKSDGKLESHFWAYRNNALFDETIPVDHGRWITVKYEFSESLLTMVRSIKVLRFNSLADMTRLFHVPGTIIDTYMFYLKNKKNIRSIYC